MKTDSGYSLKNGTKLYWDYIMKDGEENGFEIYIGDAKYPTQTQPEPFIPNPSLSYEENAIEMCKEMAARSCKEVVVRHDVTEEEWNAMKADMDYLLLLSE